MVKNLPAKARNAGLIPGLKRSPREGNGNTFQCSCMGNPMYRGGWWAIVREVTESQTQLSKKKKTKQTSIKPHLCCALVLLPWASYFTSLIFSFPILRMGEITIPINVVRIK